MSSHSFLMFLVWYICLLPFWVIAWYLKGAATQLGKNDCKVRNGGEGK